MPRWTELGKKCTQCGKVKTREEYYKRTRGTRNEYHSKCKDCSQINRENRRLKQKYGITLEDYNKMLENQKGRCKICGTTKNSGHGKFHVDHNHKTSKVRGLLCSKCNLCLGACNDNALILFKMIKYLKGEKKWLDIKIWVSLGHPKVR